MNITTRHLAAIGILTATAFTATACGSSNDAASPAVDSVPTTIATGDPAIDSAVNTGAAEAALLAMDAQSLKLPADSKSAYDQLKTDLDNAKKATGSDVATAWAKVKADVATIDGQIAAAGSDVDSTTKNAWTDVKNELDKITANF